MARYETANIIVWCFRMFKARIKARATIQLWARARQISSQGNVKSMWNGLKWCNYQCIMMYHVHDVSWLRRPLGGVSRSWCPWSRRRERRDRSLQSGEEWWRAQTRVAVLGMCKFLICRPLGRTQIWTTWRQRYLNNLKATMHLINLKLWSAFQLSTIAVIYGLWD